MCQSRVDLPFSAEQHRPSDLSPAVICVFGPHVAHPRIPLSFQALTESPWCPPPLTFRFLANAASEGVKNSENSLSDVILFEGGAICACFFLPDINGTFLG